MANQVREEARHVHSFTKYNQARFGGHIYPASDTLGHLLRQLVASHEVYEKVVGMQMLVEGLAMGAFATLHTHSNDPLLRRLCQLTMTDEAVHHKFGKIWAHATMPRLDSEQHALVEDWALQVLQTLLFNLINTEQNAIFTPSSAWIGSGCGRLSRRCLQTRIGGRACKIGRISFAS